MSDCKICLNIFEPRMREILSEHITAIDILEKEITELKKQLSEEKKKCRCLGYCNLLDKNKKLEESQKITATFNSGLQTTCSKQEKEIAELKNKIVFCEHTSAYSEADAIKYARENTDLNKRLELSENIRIEQAEIIKKLREPKKVDIPAGRFPGIKGVTEYDSE